MIAIEGTGPIDTFKRSAGLFRQKWGQQLTGNVAIGGLVFLIGILPGALLVVAGVALWSSTGFGGALLVIVGAIILAIALLISGRSRGSSASRSTATPPAESRWAASPRPLESAVRRRRARRRPGRPEPVQSHGAATRHGHRVAVMQRLIPLLSDRHPVITVWEVHGRTLRRAEPEPHPAAGLVPEALEPLRAAILAAGADPVEEHGVLAGEVAGLEICRAVFDDDGRPRLDVGIGAHDREAFALVHGRSDDVVPVLAELVRSIAVHRRPGAPPTRSTGWRASARCGAGWWRHRSCSG